MGTGVDLAGEFGELYRMERAGHYLRRREAGFRTMRDEMSPQAESPPQLGSGRT
jgi:hypothetical protein